MTNCAGALELDEAPDHTTLCKFLARLEPAAIERALKLIASQYPRYKGRATVAVNATGLSTSGLSQLLRAPAAYSDPCTLRYDNSTFTNSGGARRRRGWCTS